MTLNTNHSMTIDPSQTPCSRCTETKESHPESRYYADADDDPAAELLGALEGLVAMCRADGYRDEHLEVELAVIAHAEAAIDNARVLSCRKGFDAIQAALQPEMQFEEQTEENAR